MKTLLLGKIQDDLSASPLSISQNYATDLQFTPYQYIESILEAHPSID